MANNKTSGSKKTQEKKTTVQHIGLVKADGWLEPYEAAIVGRHQHAIDKLADLTQNGKTTLSDFATGYLYFGLHKEEKGWSLREWAPNATAIYVIGDFNGWQEDEAYKLTLKIFKREGLDVRATLMREAMELIDNVKF